MICEGDGDAWCAREVRRRPAITAAATTVSHRTSPALPAYAMPSSTVTRHATNTSPPAHPAASRVMPVRTRSLSLSRR